MKFDENHFRQELRTIVAGASSALIDFKQAQFERDVAEGWRCFNTRALWARENAPGPHLNELGRRYMSEELLATLFKEPGNYYTGYQSSYILEFLQNKEARKGYRNLFQLGALDLETRESPGNACDDVVNDTANRLFQEAHRHVAYELRYQRPVWYLEGLAKGTLTPAPTLYEYAPVEPVRDPSVPLEHDSKYWQAVYFVNIHVVADPKYRSVQTKPDCTIDLMGKLAPDFPYAPHLSSVKRLVFVQPGDSSVAWATLIEKPDGCPEYVYPAKLVLIRRDLETKLQNKHILFSNVLQDEAAQAPLWPREVEITLLYHLPRIRRLIELYNPFVTQALGGP